MIEVFRDHICHVTINDTPCTLGHIRVYPNTSVSHIEQLESPYINHLFTVASLCASILFEGLKSHGTMVIIQNNDNAHIQVIARFQDDTLGMIWDPKPADRVEIEKYASSIKNAYIPIEQIPDTSKAQDKPPVELPDQTTHQQQTDPWNPPGDQRIKMLRRQP